MVKALNEVFNVTRADGGVGAFDVVAAGNGGSGQSLWQSLGKTNAVLIIAPLVAVVVLLLVFCVCCYTYEKRRVRKLEDLRQRKKASSYYDATGFASSPLTVPRASPGNNPMAATTASGAVSARSSQVHQPQAPPSQGGGGGGGGGYEQPLPPVPGVEGAETSATMPLPTSPTSSPQPSPDAQAPAQTLGKTAPSMTPEPMRVEQQSLSAVPSAATTSAVTAAPSAVPPEKEETKELRQDYTDGWHYDMESFFAAYGVEDGQARWDSAAHTARNILLSDLAQQE